MIFIFGVSHWFTNTDTFTFCFFRLRLISLTFLSLTGWFIFSEEFLDEWVFTFLALAYEMMDFHTGRIIVFISFGLGPRLPFGGIRFGSRLGFSLRGWVEWNLYLREEVDELTHDEDGWYDEANEILTSKKKIIQA